jgi:hypothetical protein
MNAKADQWGPPVSAQRGRLGRAERGKGRRWAGWAVLAEERTYFSFSLFVFLFSISFKYFKFK